MKPPLTQDAINRIEAKLSDRPERVGEHWYDGISKDDVIALVEQNHRLRNALSAMIGPTNLSIAHLRMATRILEGGRVRRCWCVGFADDAR
jgi:hypothetical protein